MTYDALPELEPPQLWIRLLENDSVLIRVPVGIYKIENRRLVICEVVRYRRSVMGVPLGPVVRVEWPKTFSGDCIVLDRQ